MAKFYDKWRNRAKALFKEGFTHTEVYTDPALWKPVGLHTPEDLGIDQSTMTLWKRKALEEMDSPEVVEQVEKTAYY